MLNILWPIFIILSIVYGLFIGKIDDVNNSIFESAEEAVNLTIFFFGAICMWNGIIKIASRTSLMTKLTKVLNPLIGFLFPEIKKTDKAHEQISMNIVANILGLGNAATPLGLKAMREFTKAKYKQRYFK